MVRRWYPSSSADTHTYFTFCYVFPSLYFNKLDESNMAVGQSKHKKSLFG